MVASIIGTAAIARVAAPLIKDLYESAKGQSKKALQKWASAGFAQKFAKRIADIDTVRTIWSPEKSISLRKFYYPSRIKTGDSASLPVERLSDLGEGNVVLQGIVGQGKSILLRYLAVQEILEGTSKRIPIFLELRKITKAVSLIAAVQKVLSAFDVEVTTDVLDDLLHSGKIVLLLDGFDELEATLVRDTTLELEALVLRYPETQFIVTSRPHNEVQKLTSFRVLEIAPLKAEDHSPFLGALGVRTTKAAEIVHAIESSPSKVSELITTPLMLTLVVFVYESESQIPADLPEFFDRLFHTVFTRHDRLKAAFEREHYSGLSERQLQHLFEAFCFMALQGGHSRTLSRQQFTEAFQLAQDYVEGSECKEEAFRRDITNVACPMLEDGVDDFTFLHKSIAEYHSAAFVKDSDDAFCTRFYKEASNDWVPWQETLRFLQSIDPYRFAKYFGIGGLQQYLDLLRRLAVAENGAAVTKLLPAWLDGVGVGYKRRSPDTANYRRGFFGAYRSADNFYSEELASILCTATFAAAPLSVTTDEMTELSAGGRMIRHERDDEVVIPLAHALDLWGMKQYSQALERHVISVSARLTRAQQLADKLVSRTRIFDRKPKQ